jgi:hypothetical protein
MISAQFGKHLGGRVKRAFNSSSTRHPACCRHDRACNASSMQAPESPMRRRRAREQTPQSSLQIQVCSRQIDKQDGQQRHPSTRQIPESHGGKMTKCTDCAASTGPLQLKAYAP